MDDNLPAFLTVEEAARVLRIGRTAAYELTHVYRATNGNDGLPVVRLGRTLRVPRVALEALARASIREVPTPPPEPAADVVALRATSPRRTRTARRHADQASLPFSG